MAREKGELTPPQEALPPQENGENIDPNKFLVTFTGQNSQFSGMGKDLYQNSEEARAVFHEADEAVGFPLSEIMFEGPEEMLKETDKAQIAILTFEVATIRTVEALSGTELKPKAFAGHSLGNYAAIVAADVTTFKHAIGLVQERGRLMQEAAIMNPGTMAAIMGLDLQVLMGICEETGAELGIINTENQAVITGSKRAVAQAIDLATSSKAKARELNVSGAWHSSLMASAQIEFQRVISDIPFNDPSRPIYDNSTGKLLTTGGGIQKALARGLTKPVYWNYLFKRGITGASAAVEIGPKDILSGFAKQIKRDLKIIPVSSFESAQKLAQLMKQPNLNPQRT